MPQAQNLKGYWYASDFLDTITDLGEFEGHITSRNDLMRKKLYRDMFPEGEKRQALDIKWQGGCSSH